MSWCKLLMAQILQIKQKKKPKARLYCFKYKDEMMHNFIKIKDISLRYKICGRQCINTGYLNNGLI